MDTTIMNQFILQLIIEMICLDSNPLEAIEIYDNGKFVELSVYSLN